MSSHATEDYEKLRDNLYELLADAKDALQTSKAILKESEHPRAVETYSGLLNNVVRLNSQILELSKTHKVIVERSSYNDPELQQLPDGQAAPPAKVYIGTTADLQNMLREARREDEANATIDVTPEEF